MRRAASVLLVLLTSVMLGKAPCCRIHDFTAPVEREVRGPGQHGCPCCDKPGRHQHGPQQQRIGKPCPCEPLIASLVTDSDAIDLPLALPIPSTFVPPSILEAWNSVPADATRAPPLAPAALTLPLLL